MKIYHEDKVCRLIRRAKKYSWFAVQRIEWKYYFSDGKGLFLIFAGSHPKIIQQIHTIIGRELMDGEIVGSPKRNLYEMFSKLTKQRKRKAEPTPWLYQYTDMLGKAFLVGRYVKMMQLRYWEVFEKSMKYEFLPYCSVPCFVVSDIDDPVAVIAAMTGHPKKLPNVDKDDFVQQLE